MFMRVLLCAALAAVTLPAQPAANPANTLISPEVGADRKVTFRLYAPKAAEVSVRGEWMEANLSLTKAENGVWSATTGPVEPGVYSYAFTVDGVSAPDPRQGFIKSGNRGPQSAIEIPGEAADFMMIKDAPHGAVSEHWYLSKAVNRMRRVHVYTPPAYDAAKKTRYPVLYLLHGSGDTDREWSDFGRANIILDTLINSGKAKPMIVVMTDGHVADINDPAQRSKNTALYGEDLTGSVMPLVEARYRIDARRERRALAGLSMGGGQTLNVGLKNLDKFSQLGVFSMGVAAAAQETFLKDHAAVLDDAGATNKKLKLFWIACGDKDFLFASATNLHQLLEKKGITHKWTVSSGGHTWINWRLYLRDFAPLLF